jgi:hypothetical protein
MLQDTGEEWSAEERQLQREFFLQIHTIFSELQSNGYSASIQRSNQSEVNLVISSPPASRPASPDDPWSEVIEYQLTDYLDVPDQLIHQEFDPESSRPTVLSARFQGSQLVLSPLMDHGGATNVICGIRCRDCDRKLGPCNISYVGQTTRSVHARVCGEHAREVASTIERINEARCATTPPTTTTTTTPTTPTTRRRPMYQHAANHFFDDLPENTQARDVFRLVMDVIILPTGSGDLHSWECFWQFFCRCRTFFFGWSEL